MLGAILSELAQGHTVALSPMDHEISTQKAADLLNVSRPYPIKLLGSGVIPFRKVGSHRRIRVADLLAYKARLDVEADHASPNWLSRARNLEWDTRDGPGADYRPV